jgi:hypothetical protein
MPTTQAGQCQTKLGVVHGFERRFERSWTTQGAQLTMILPSWAGGRASGSWRYKSNGKLNPNDPGTRNNDVDKPCAAFLGISPRGTQAFGINLAGAITGVYTEANVGNHGFLRARDGTITTFDPPGPISMFGIFGIDLFINPEGVITGAYKELDPTNPFGGNYRVIVRTPDGDFTTFDAATYASCCVWSFPYGVTPAGAITGSLNTAIILIMAACGPPTVP